MLKFCMAIISCSAFLNLQAQKEIPKEFSSGSVILSDSTIVKGYIKESIRSHAAVLIMTEAGGKKKNYTGNELIAATIDSSRFLCIKGDFFRIVCDGEISFLQKSSDASGKPVYNGTEALFINGTEGRVNDYFFYDSKQQQLKLLTRKNMGEIVAGTFNNCTAAIAKARETGSDLAQLRQAVEIYNNRNGK
jgi:hypothetical protein